MQIFKSIKIRICLFILLALLQILLSFQINQYLRVEVIKVQSEIGLDDTHLIRLLNWNIGARDSDSFPGGALSISARVNRMKQLASVIVQNEADVVTLQEFVNFPDGRNDLDNLVKSLEELNYHMYLEIIPYYDVTEVNPYTWNLVTLSKMPIDKENSKTVVLSPNRRSRVSLINDTKFGKFFVANFHTNLSEPCKQMGIMLDFISPTERMSTIIAGDANITFTNFYGEPEQMSKKECKGRDWGIVDNTCKDGVYNCEPKDAKCRNSSACWGDYVYLFRPSNFYLKNIKSIGNVNNISDGHPAIISEIGTYLPVIPSIEITPVPSIILPSIEPSSQDMGLVIDLNKDGKVDITDFSLFVEYYKVGNVKIDFDKDGKTQRDIEDLNYFIQEYKKEKPDRNE